MERKRGTVRDALCENLRELMKRRLFDKITIKQICDETGVIRATFYNHFDDKYDCLNAIVEGDIVGSMHDDYSSTQALYNGLREVFATVEREKEFYRAAWQVTGQNSFGDMVANNYQAVLMRYMKNLRNPAILSDYSNELLSAYYANSLTFVTHMMVFSREELSPSQALNMINSVASYSAFELLKKGS